MRTLQNIEDSMQIIEKPWGREEVLEHNDRYMVKRLTMFNGQRCSLQLHQHKRETIYVLSGKLTLVHGEHADALEKSVHGAGESFTLAPGIVHRMQAEHGDCVYLEASTPEMDDVIRLSDDYQRVE